MDADEKRWIENMVALTESASRSNVMVMFVRRQDSENLADVVVTNATPEMVAHMAVALNGREDQDA